MESGEGSGSQGEMKWSRLDEAICREHCDIQIMNVGENWENSSVTCKNVILRARESRV